MNLSFIDYLKTSQYASYDNHNIIDNKDDYDNKDYKDNKYVINIINNENIYSVPYIYNSILPNPCIYFKSPHTFLKSYLYLTNSEFAHSSKYSLKSDIMLKRYIKDKINEESKKKIIGIKAKFYRKLISDNNFDTDPTKNIYFNKFIDLLLNDNKEDFIIVRCGKNGLCNDTIPNKIPRNSVLHNKKLKKYYVFLMKYDGLFAPYGITYSY